MDSTNPCIIYQRLRPSEPEASKYAQQEIWPMAHELVAHKGYVISGLYGDSEFAPPFCGGSEIRPGFESALKHAEEISAEVGSCTLIIGDASPIGGGDPFLPDHMPADGEGQVDVSLVNFHLQPHIIAMPLLTAWQWFDRHREVQTQPQRLGVPLDLVGPKWEIEIFVRRDPERLLASLYVANPTQRPITLKWAQLLRRLGQNARDIEVGGWRALEVQSGCGAQLVDVYQGELPWVRQLRFKHEHGGRKRVGSLHLTPSDMMRDRLALLWEDRH